jgi:nucleoredoxin
MRRVLFIVVLFFGVWAGQSMGQNDVPNPASASDNPTAGLSLDDSTPLTGFAARFNHHLITLDEGQSQDFDASTLKDVKYWAFYYSAAWCEPCKTFTPELVDFYNGFKPQHSNFELIFVSQDANEGAMLDEMKATRMPWPAVRFDDIDKLKANKYLGAAVPDLVLVDANGKVLSDSFRGVTYVHPEQVIEDIKNMVPIP